MNVSTYLFGQVEVDPDRVINFPRGLVGFENQQRYLLVHETGNEAPVSFTLQSLDDPALAFQIIEPAAMGFSYELALTEDEVKLLQEPEFEDIVIVMLLYKRSESDGAPIGANFRAPLIINTKARIGLQKVIEKPRPSMTISNLSSQV